jgi:SAM-dependent methyltransferase
MLAGRPSERYDLVTAFQVLEHVANPLDTLREVSRTMSEHADLIVALPNADGVIRWLRPATLNMPPHHLSWWTANAVAVVASRCDLRVVETAFEPLSSLHFGYLEAWFRWGVLRGVGAAAPRGLRLGLWTVHQGG